MAARVNTGRHAQRALMHKPKRVKGVSSPKGAGNLQHGVGSTKRSLALTRRT